MIVAATNECGEVIRENPDRTVLSVDIGEVASADELYRAFVRQLRTDPQMDPDGSMLWDALVDGVGNGIDATVPLERAVILTVGPADLLRARNVAVLDELMAWLEQLEERIERNRAPAPRLLAIVHGNHASFAR